jgi:hypothetical protein
MRVGNVSVSFNTFWSHGHVRLEGNNLLFDLGCVGEK